MSAPTGRAGGAGVPAGTAMSDERRAIRIDPRIKQRRIEVRREEGRRRLRFLVGVVVVLLLAGLGAAATRSPILDVDHIHVTGAPHTARKDVLAVGRLKYGRLMIEVDTGSSARRIETLRSVASATVTREWPSTVRVELVERTPVAAIAVAEGRWAPVDRHGRILDPVDVRPPLPHVLAIAPVAPETRMSPRHARPALALAAALPPGLRDRVDALEAQDDNLELRLRGGGVVRLGPPNDLPAKLAALDALLERVDAAVVAVIDVRVPDAPVLTRR